MLLVFALMTVLLLLLLLTFFGAGPNACLARGTLRSKDIYALRAKDPFHQGSQATEEHKAADHMASALRKQIKHSGSTPFSF